MLRHHKMKIVAYCQIGITYIIHRLINGVLLCLFFLGLVIPFDKSHAISRIKDLVSIEGVRENQLLGYGLVVGLAGTGDTLNNSPFTRQSIEAMLERFGVNILGSDNLSTANVAAVVVTANLPSFTTNGSRIDVAVSALGDSSSLEGGTLLVTPLMAADGEVYAVAQGALTVGGFNVQGEAGSVRRGISTSAKIASGALVEREMNFSLDALPVLRLTLHNPDFTTVKRITDVINLYIGEKIAMAYDASRIELKKPSNVTITMASLITEIEQLSVEPDQSAKVVIDEQAGVIVMGKDVRISEVAIAQGNLTVSVSERPEASQPQPFSQGGTTQTLQRTDINIDDGSNAKIAVVRDKVTLEGLVKGLNALGVGPRDIISILQSIKAAGALQAEIIVM